MSADRLYLMQHGLAVDKSENPERPLSPAGIKQTEEVALRIKDSAATISQVFHSGKLRALQTAEIIASALDVKSVSAIDHLSPNAEVTLIEKDLTINDALYIGHLPHLARLLSYLVCGNEDLGILKFQNSAISCLEKNHNQYLVRWYLTPEIA